MAPRLAIGVMGSASGEHEEGVLARCETLGKTIAERGCTLITGACPGLSYAAVQGARAAGGLIVGISPGLSRDEQVLKYASPVEGFDVLIYTGSGLMGREIENIRSSDIVVIVGGNSGTLGEFAIAYDEGRLIGVLTATGGIAGHIPDLVGIFSKTTGAHVHTTMIRRASSTASSTITTQSTTHARTASVSLPRPRSVRRWEEHHRWIQRSLLSRLNWSYAAISF